MKPIIMKPSYRFGNMTPWGGDGLKRYFGREIPDEITGEGMEVSAIPGLESTDENGTPLSMLLEKYGTDITGRASYQTFPLLLKLISAKSDLSVQVHPDNDYALKNENKLGKTEAWVILHAEPDATILYGLKDGVTLNDLREALMNHSDLEPMLNRVHVHDGEVYYMPSGMVHAIGGGILLYEIQQSSDVTYRLWDYDRVNAQGEKRPLHIRQSLDVIQTELKGKKTILPKIGQGRAKTLLNESAFSLKCVLINGIEIIEKEDTHFRILTSLDHLSLKCEEEQIELVPGQSLLIPASCSKLKISGIGRLLIAEPPLQK